MEFARFVGSGNRLWQLRVSGSLKRHMERMLEVIIVIPHVLISGYNGIYDLYAMFRMRKCEFHLKPS